jgi:hypothetical protein
MSKFTPVRLFEPGISEKNNHFYIFAAISVAMLLISFIAIVLLFLRRRTQPIMKKSPKLMICSVIGNFLIILNI